MWYSRRNMLKFEKENKKKVRNDDGITNNMRSDPGPGRINRESIRSDQGPRRNDRVIFRESRCVSESRGF